MKLRYSMKDRFSIRIPKWPIWNKIKSQHFWCANFKPQIYTHHHCRLHRHTVDWLSSASSSVILITGSNPHWAKWEACSLYPSITFLKVAGSPTALLPAGHSMPAHPKFPSTQNGLFKKMKIMLKLDLLLSWNLTKSCGIFALRGTFQHFCVFWT